MKVKNASFIIPLIVVAFTIPRAITYALDDIYLPYTSAKETADIINEKIEDDAIIIEGDAIAANNFGMSTYIQISKNVTFYNIPLNMKDDYKAKQRYGTDDQKKYDEFSYLDDDELARLLDEVSKEYEHVYYVSSLVRTCKGAETDRNIEVIGKYESIALLNQGEYLDNYNPTLKIYKIK